MTKDAGAKAALSASASVPISLCHHANKMPTEGDNRKREGV